jgi:hypothetical protein
VFFLRHPFSPSHHFKIKEQAGEVPAIQISWIHIDMSRFSRFSPPPADEVDLMADDMELARIEDDHQRSRLMAPPPPSPVSMQPRTEKIAPNLHASRAERYATHRRDCADVNRFPYAARIPTFAGNGRIGFGFIQVAAQPAHQFPVAY